ncbi:MULTISPECIES: hypothetical protein [Pseudomonas]
MIKRKSPDFFGAFAFLAVALLCTMSTGEEGSAACVAFNKTLALWSVITR